MLIALDSNVFIAALSGNEEHSLAAQQLLREVAAGKHRAVASSIVYGEILSVSTGRVDLEGFFASVERLVTIPADDGVCLQAGQLRQAHGGKLKLPDAMHAATALLANADIFVTNDKQLASVTQKIVPTKSLADWQ